jgi:hypothetical protein
MPRSLKLRMALAHTSQILREFWATCSRMLHLVHTPPPAQEFSHVGRSKNRTVRRVQA